MILKRQTLFLSLSLSLSLILLTEIQYQRGTCHPFNIFAVLLRRGELQLKSCELTFIRRCDLCIYAGITLIETEKCEHTRTSASNFSQINYLRIRDIHFSCKFTKCSLFWNSSNNAVLIECQNFELARICRDTVFTLSNFFPAIPLVCLPYLPFTVAEQQNNNINNVINIAKQEGKASLRYSSFVF